MYIITYKDGSVHLNNIFVEYKELHDYIKENLSEYLDSNQIIIREFSTKEELFEIINSIIIKNKLEIKRKIRQRDRLTDLLDEVEEKIHQIEHVNTTLFDNMHYMASWIKVLN